MNKAKNRSENAGKKIACTCNQCKKWIGVTYYENGKAPLCDECKKGLPDKKETLRQEHTS